MPSSAASASSAASVLASSPATSSPPLGFIAFALTHSLAQALPALFLGGFGLGEIIASSNILAGRRWSAHTGSALALINLFWSFGAVSTGLLAAALLPRFGWRKPTLGLGLLLLVVGVGGALFRSVATSPGPEPAAASRLGTREILRFGTLLLLYGGLETCLTAWLTTFTLRVAGGALLGGQSGFVILWAALTAGRAVASASMRRWSETAVQRTSLLLCLLLIVSLSLCHSAVAISVTCILLGLALAPVFPSTFALLLRRNPSARIAGVVLAVSGLGAALFPWLMGAVSTYSGSLRLAMIVPALLVPAMFAFTRSQPSAPPAATP